MTTRRTTDPHRVFGAWLTDGAMGEPPRDVALHASVCPGCLRQVGALDALAALDLSRAVLPASRLRPAPRGVSLRWSAATAAGVVGLAVLGLGATQLVARGARLPSGSPAEAVLAATGTPGGSVPASATPSSAPPASPSPFPEPTGSGSPATTAAPSSATEPLPTVAPRTPRPATPTPTTPARTPLPTAVATPLPSATTLPTPTGTPTPTDAPTPTPSAAPTPSATPQSTATATSTASRTPHPTKPPGQVGP